MIKDTERIGEVVRTATQNFTTQCYRLYNAPSLGALVRSSSPEIYSVVSRITTESLYPGRPVLPRGEEEESEKELYRANPQLERLLCTRFESIIIAHREDDAVIDGLPPGPPGIHAFVYPCTFSNVRDITHSMHFLNLLLSANIPTGDEVISACLRAASVGQVEREEFLLRAGKALAIELAEDLTRLSALLRRIAP